MRWLALLPLLSLPAPAQHLHLGLKGGVPLNDLVKSEGRVSNLASRWTLGPMVDLDLPLGLGIELDALYRRTGYRETEDHTAGSWEFPLLLKYKFPGFVARPYIGGGWVYRNVGDIPRLAAGSNGVVFAGGLQIRVPAIRLTPEVRWTRWEGVPAGPLSVQAARNQLEVLLGLTF